MCHFHNVKLSEATNNRICCHFEPNQEYWNSNSIFSPPSRRFGWFATDLKPGVLYEFPYNSPDQLDESAILRIPDYQTGEWCATSSEQSDESNETQWLLKSQVSRMWARARWPTTIDSSPCEIIAMSYNNLVLPTSSAPKVTSYHCKSRSIKCLLGSVALSRYLCLIRAIRGS